MKSINKHKSPQVQRSSTTFDSRSAFQWVQQRWVHGMEHQRNPKSKKRQWLIFAGFVLLCTVFCCSRIAQALWPSDTQPSTSVLSSRFQLPQEGFSSPRAPVRSPPPVMDQEHAKIKQLRELVDSLNSSPTGSASAHIILQQCQWLIDSLRIIENLPNQHSHGNQPLNHQTTPAP